jgi:hypothetical protein
MEWDPEDQKWGRPLGGPAELVQLMVRCQLRGQRLLSVYALEGKHEVCVANKLKTRALTSRLHELGYAIVCVITWNTDCQTLASWLIRESC